MATNKPTKPSNEFLSTGFGGVKNDFSSTLKSRGFEANSPQILQGDNLNFSLDTIGLQLKYLTIIADYINGINSGKVPYVNGNGQFDVADINTLLPSQTDQNGKFLTTNGSVCSWSNDFRVIGEPIFTLNFNKVLAENEVWLDGTAGTNHDGVVPIDGIWATLFSIYGWVYDTSYTNTDYFKLPNFTNKCIWGGTTAGYIGAGLPNITANTVENGDHNHNKGTMEISGSFWDLASSGAGKNSEMGDADGAFYTKARGVGNSIHKATDVTKTAENYDGIGFRASRTWSGKTETKGKHTHIVNVSDSNTNILGKSNTVQPPAIKVRVYTRVY